MIFRANSLPVDLKRNGAVKVWKRATNPDDQSETEVSLWLQAPQRYAGDPHQLEPSDENYKHKYPIKPE